MWFRQRIIHESWKNTSLFILSVQGPKHRYIPFACTTCLILTRKCFSDFFVVFTKQKFLPGNLISLLWLKLFVALLTYSGSPRFALMRMASFCIHSLCIEHLYDRNWHCFRNTLIRCWMVKEDIPLQIVTKNYICQLQRQCLSSNWLG